MGTCVAARYFRRPSDVACRGWLGHRSQPLVGVDHELPLVGDGRKGLGAPVAALVPTDTLLASLDLYPSDGCTYRDADGDGLALVTWRAEYETTEYELAWPRTCKSRLVIRPDLLNRVANSAGERRRMLRDFWRGKRNSRLSRLRPKRLPETFCPGFVR
jgi:hypothetical protein